MLPVVSVWCDSTYYTDVDLLVAIAASSPDAAVGVLANRNVTGDAYARVLSHAALTVANVTAVGPRFLVAGRGAAEQEQLVVATAARSVPAAERVIEEISPEAALRLYRRATTTRFRGSGPVQAAVQELALSGGHMLRSREPGYRDLVTSVVADTGVEPASFGPLAAAASTREHLMHLTDLLAANPPHGVVPPTGPVEALRTATVGHPDVVAHWATHAGVWGLFVAAGDHRQDPALLASLTHPDPMVRAYLARLLVANPAADTADLRARAVAEAATLLNSPQTSPRTVQMWAEHAVKLLTREVELDRRGHRTPPALLSPGQLDVANLADTTRLYNLELLDNPHLSDGQLATVVQDLSAIPVSGLVAARVVAALDTRRALESVDPDTSGNRWLAVTDPDRFTDRVRERTTPAAPTVHHLTAGALVKPLAGVIEHDLAPLLAGRLSTVDQHRTLFAHLDVLTRWTLPLLPLLDDVTVPAPPRDRYAHLLPDALGSLG